MVAPTRNAGRGQSLLRLEEVARDFIPALSRSSGLVIGSSGKTFAPSQIYQTCPNPPFPLVTDTQPPPKHPGGFSPRPKMDVSTLSTATGLFLTM